jgi:transcriptional regulator with XRE-family HTH domain
MAPRIKSYLRTYRKRAALTQDELAFLLGCKSGAKVSRYELLSRRPNLQTALACQAIFGVPAHEIFPGVYAEVEQEIAKRAHCLSERVKSGKVCATANRKTALFRDIASRNGSTHALPP